MQLVLSLFPGIGLLDMAFELEGFTVVRGPDVLWGGDIRKFHPPAGKFDGVIGGPPCQAFLSLSNINRKRWGDDSVMPNLIPEFERCVREAKPAWYAMENVPEAPLPVVQGYATWSTLLNNRQCIDKDGKPATQNRTRRWTFGDRRHGRRTVLMIETAAIENLQWDRAAIGGSGGTSLGAAGWDGYGSGVALKKKRTRRSFAELCELQGLTADFDLPPFTEAAKCKAIGNGVPLPMGRAIAKAVMEATGLHPTNQE